MKTIKAAKMAVQIGLKIQADFPQVADDYRGGLFKSEIIEKYGFCEIFGITQSVALSGLQRALSGNYGFDEEYEGLIPLEERAIIQEHHQQRAGTFGIESLTTEDRQRQGEYIRDNQLGIFAMTPEEIDARNKKAGRHAALARGQIPWEEEHKEYLLEIAADPDNYRKNGFIDGEIVIEKLYVKFGIERNKGTALRWLRRLRNGR